MSSNPLPAHWAKRLPTKAELKAADVERRRVERAKRIAQEICDRNMGFKCTRAVMADMPVLMRESDRARIAREARDRAGLVSISTTHTRLPKPGYLRVQKLRRRVRWTADYIHRKLGGKPAMLTLTYADADAWKPEHITALLNHMRNWMRRHGDHTFRYVWVAELQQRGAVHYHVLVWLPRGLTLPKPDKQGWWPHGMTNWKWAKKAVGYITKYATKLESKMDEGFPKGMRLHGSGGLDDHGVAHRAWRFLPEWIRNECHPGMRVTRKEGGGFVSRETGETWESPWEISGWTFVPGVGRLLSIRKKWSTEQ